ncbi:GDP-L-fucose synthase family protein [Thermodesulfobacteriota bacterium]
MEKKSKIYVAGHTGLVGSALLGRLKAENYSNLILRSHDQMDLERQSAVESFFQAEKPEYVFLAAAKVGGILANNTYPAEFIYNNLAIQTNVIHAAWKTGVRRLIFLGSSCIYPRESPQPIKEEYMLTGPLEKTNEPYALSKIAGIKMCQSYNRQYDTQFLAVMPTNLFGPNDNFDLENSHVLPAMIRKFHLAKLAAQGMWESIQDNEKKYGPIPADLQAGLISIARHSGHQVSMPDNSSLPAPAVPLWGTGNPRREFLYVDDLVDACIFIINLDNDAFRSLLTESVFPLINIGSGIDNTIKALSSQVKTIVGYKGEVTFDTSKPDGTPQKLLDIAIISELGWKPRISLKQGIQLTYQWFLEN